MQRSQETASFGFNHTMIRVKDPKVSLDFYTRILGMSQIAEHKASDFTLFFLGYLSPEDVGKSQEELAAKKGGREALLELTWNHGTESDDSFKGYKNGNDDESKGFGHIAISVDDVEVACKRFTELGVKFKKRPEDGKMRHIAFILDPDNYWVEIIPRQKM